MATEPHTFNLEQAGPILAFVNERHAIFMRKAVLEQQAEMGWPRPKLSAAGKAAWGSPEEPWTLDRLTADPILSRYRFCNVFRELDRVTVWVREHIREPFADHPDLWWMLAAARFINWPPTLDGLIRSTRATWPDKDGFQLRNITAHTEALKAAGLKVETGAYMIRAENDRTTAWGDWSKQRYVAEVVLGSGRSSLGPWTMRAEVSRMLEDPATCLEDAWKYFMEAGPRFGWVGWGPFMAGQVVADLRRTRYLREAPDVGRWAPVGIGSARGLNRLAGRKVTAQISQAQGLAEMLQLQSLVNKHSASFVPKIELHDIQNCLCETDKYLRVQTGEGRPRAQYAPGRGC